MIKIPFAFMFAFGVSVLMAGCGKDSLSKHARQKFTEIRCAAIASEIAIFEVDVSNFVVELLQKGVNKQYFLPTTEEFDEVSNAPNDLTEDQIAKICPYQAHELTERIFVVYDAKSWQGKAFYVIAVRDYGVVESWKCSRDELQDRLDKVEPEKILSKLKMSALKP